MARLSHVMVRGILLQCTPVIDAVCMCTHTHNPNVYTENGKKWMYSVIIWIHFEVAIFSWHSHAQQVFLAPFTGVFDSIFCLWLSLIFSVRDLWGRGKCLHIFFRGLMCMCARAHTHSACGVLKCEPRRGDETPGEPGRNPDVL